MWIEVVWVDIVALVLITEEKESDFLHLVWCYLSVFMNDLYEVLEVSYSLWFSENF